MSERVLDATPFGRRTCALRIVASSPSEVMTVVNGGWLPTFVRCFAPMNALILAAEAQSVAAAERQLRADLGVLAAERVEVAERGLLAAARRVAHEAVAGRCVTVSWRIASGIPSCSAGIGSLDDVQAAVGPQLQPHADDHDAGVDGAESRRHLHGQAGRVAR